MTVTQILYFLEVAKHESFSKAAAELYISHQVLSNQIKALEKELGIELIDRRNKRKICLTDSGKILFDAWSQIHEIYENAYQQAVRLQEAKSNTLVIGIQDMRFVRSYVVPLIRKLQDSSEKINLEYRLGTPVEMVQMLESGQVDMLIMIASDLNSEVECFKKVLYPNALHLVAAMSKSHPLAKRKKVSLKDLKDETLLMIGDSYSGEASKRFQKDQEEGGMPFVPQKIKYFNSPRTINIALETGMGVALIFDELLEEARDEIKTFPVRLPNADRIDMLLVWKDPKLDETADMILQLRAEN